MVPPSYDNLVEEVADAVASHYQQWIIDHPTDEIYAYVIYATSLVTHVAVSVLTEQGLKQVASHYKDKLGYKESLDELQHDLRWSVADTPYCGDIQDVFDSVNARLRLMLAYVDSLEIDDPAFDTHMDTLYSILVAALKHFRQTQLHNNIRPMLYVDFGDMSDEERLWFITRCNDPEVVASYRRSLESTG